MQNTIHTFKCRIKSSARNQITLYLQNTEDDSQSNAYTINNIGSDWTECEIKVNPGSNTRNSIVFNIEDVAGDVYIDAVSLTRDNDQSKTELMINNDMINAKFLVNIVCAISLFKHFHVLESIFKCVFL